MGRGDFLLLLLSILFLWGSSILPRSREEELQDLPTHRGHRYLEVVINGTSLGLLSSEDPSLLQATLHSLSSSPCLKGFSKDNFKNGTRLIFQETPTRCLRRGTLGLEGWKSRTLGLPVAINEASSSDLVAIPGIGPHLSEQIVRRRTEQGPFTSWKELLDMKGVGEKRREAIEKGSTLEVGWIGQL